MQRTNDDELNGHEEPQEVVDDLEDRPSLHPEKLPAPRTENKGVPCRDGQSAHEEILVCREMRGEVEVGREVAGGDRHGEGRGGADDDGRLEGVNKRVA